MGIWLFFWGLVNDLIKDGYNTKCVVDFIIQINYNVINSLTIA